MNKPDISYFLQQAKAEAEKSKCLRSKVGAVLVKDEKIISFGHNGPIEDGIDCIKKGCIREELNIPHGEKNDFCYGICAEQKAILDCLRRGISCDGADIYTTWQPCSICVKILIEAKIKQVFYIQSRGDEFSNSILKNSNLVTIKI